MIVAPQEGHERQLFDELQALQRDWQQCLRTKASRTGGPQVRTLFAAVQSVDVLLSQFPQDVFYGLVLGARERLRLALNRLSPLDFFHVQKIGSYEAFFRELDAILEKGLPVATKAPAPIAEVVPPQGGGADGTLKITLCNTAEGVSGALSEPTKFTVNLENYATQLDKEQVEWVRQQIEAGYEDSKRVNEPLLKIAHIPKFPDKEAVFESAIKGLTQRQVAFMMQEGRSPFSFFVKISAQSYRMDLLEALVVGHPNELDVADQGQKTAKIKIFIEDMARQHMIASKRTSSQTVEAWEWCFYQTEESVPKKKLDLSSEAARVSLSDYKRGLDVAGVKGSDRWTYITAWALSSLRGRLLDCDNSLGTVLDAEGMLYTNPYSGSLGLLRAECYKNPANQVTGAGIGVFDDGFRECEGKWRTSVSGPICQTDAGNGETSGSPTLANLPEYTGALSPTLAKLKCQYDDLPVASRRCSRGVVTWRQVLFMIADTHALVAAVATLSEARVCWIDDNDCLLIVDGCRETDPRTRDLGYPRARAAATGIAHGRLLTSSEYERLNDGQFDLNNGTYLESGENQWYPMIGKWSRERVDIRQGLAIREGDIGARRGISIPLSFEPITRGLTPEVQTSLLTKVKARFDAHPERHPEMNWADVQASLEASPDLLWSLNEMETRGHEPDVYKEDMDDFYFGTCSKETPQMDRNIVYDSAAQALLASNWEDVLATGYGEMLVEHYDLKNIVSSEKIIGVLRGLMSHISPKVVSCVGNAVDIANDMGIEVMPEVDYRDLRTLGSFDTETWSYLQRYSDYAPHDPLGPRAPVGNLLGSSENYATIHSPNGGFRGRLKVPKTTKKSVRV